MANKTVLIISYYWPPAGGISVLRSLKISKYLVDNGWNPVVLTVGNPQYPIIDDNNLKHIHPECKVITADAFQPFSLYKKLTNRKKKDTLANVLNANSGKTGFIHKLSVWVRANFFIPDARSSWIKPAVKHASNYIKQHKIDAIFSDGPPHTNTVIAYQLSKKFNIPWLMDWQDPWTEVDYYKMFPIGKRADRKHKALEQACLKQCSAMTIVSPTWKKDVENLGAKNVDVIYWGYDKEDFKGLTKNITDKFIISHVGLLGEDRVSESLFSAISDLCIREDGFREKVKLVFIGTVTNRINELILKYQLESICEIQSQIPRKEALQLILDSDINLLLLNIAENAKGRVPGKLFEYIYANNSILNLGPLDCDVDTILRELEIGTTCAYEDKAGIINFITKEFNKTQEETYKRDLYKYSIQYYTKRIAEILNTISN